MSDKLAEIKEALSKATKGPWEFGVFEDSRHVIYDNTYFSRHIAEIVKGGVESEQREEDNANFISNAPEWIQYLLEEVEELRKVLEYIADPENIWENLPLYAQKALGKEQTP